MPPPPEGQMICTSCGAGYEPPATRCPRDGTSLVLVRPHADPLIGKEIDGRYTIREKLGAGGMGTVYRALQHSVGRDVAMKVIHRGATDETTVKRFMREAKLAASLSQPNIVAVMDFGQASDGMLFLVMELCAGKTLHHRIRKDGPFDAAHITNIAVQLCDALAAAHRKDIIHRDLKPANVMILDEPPGRDVVKVLDFGLARTLTTDEGGPLTSSGMMVGTPHYASPEEIAGTAVDGRADLYSLGAVLYEMANCQPPFSSEGGPSMIYARQMRGEIAPFVQALPPNLERLIRRLLERSPDARPKSADAVRTLLLDYQSAPEPIAPVETKKVVVTPPATRWPVIAVLLVVLAGVAGAAGWFATARPEEAALPPPRVTIQPAPEPEPAPTPKIEIVEVAPAPVPAVVKPPVRTPKKQTKPAAEPKPCDPWCD